MTVIRRGFATGALLGRAALQNAAGATTSSASSTTTIVRRTLFTCASFTHQAKKMMMAERAMKRYHNSKRLFGSAGGGGFRSRNHPSTSSYPSSGYVWNALTKMQKKMAAMETIQTTSFRTHRPRCLLPRVERRLFLNSDIIGGDCIPLPKRCSIKIL
jgi:hypothetical protein